MSEPQVIVTSSLNKFLRGVRDKNPEQFSAFRVQTFHKINETAKFLKANGGGLDLSRKLIDLSMQKEQLLSPDKKVSCKSGCAACCFQSVAISQAEANILTGRPNGDHPSEKACRFLNKDNLCSVYEDRPSSCRTANSILDPKQCEPGGTKQELFSYEAHIYSSAESTIENKILYIKDLD